MLNDVSMTSRIDLDQKIKKAIDDLKPSVSGSYKESFVDIISEFQAA